MKKMTSFVSLSYLLKKISQLNIRKNEKSYVLHFNNYDSESKLDLYHILNILTP